MSKQKKNKRQQLSKRKEQSETDRSSITGISMEEDISGSTKPVSSAKPDLLREDHPDLAK